MSNDAQANALAQSLAPLILEALKPAISEHIETQISGLKKKNNELLDDLKKAKADTPTRTHDRNGVPFDAGYTQAHEDRQIAFEKEQAVRAAAATQAKTDAQDTARARATSDGALYISRDDARSSVLYRAAKAKAEAAGVELRVGSDAEYADQAARPAQPAASAKPSPVDMFDDALNGIRWVRADLHTGSGNVRRNADAERQGLRLRTFTTAEDLPENIRPKLALVEASMGEKDAE